MTLFQSHITTDPTVRMAAWNRGNTVVESHPQTAAMTTLIPCQAA